MPRYGHEGRIGRSGFGQFGNGLVTEVMGKPQAFVSYYEHGVRRLDLLELRQICGVLGIPLVQFVRKFEKALQDISDVGTAAKRR